MSRTKSFAAALGDGAFDEPLHTVYGDAVSEERARLAALAAAYRSHFGTDPAALFSAPGRTELGGNHTDHNAGRVLAGSVSLDTVAAATARTDCTARLVSDGFGAPVEVDLSGTEPLPGERETSAALVRGVSAYLAARGYRTGGFDAYVTSRVRPGSGLSSSAAFEVLVATVISAFHNDGRVGVIDRAAAGKYAENEYFGKPSGLMDQIACAAGGVVAIDFETEWPRLEQLPIDFRVHGYRLYAVHTGGSHVDLTDAYADVVTEMKAVATALGGGALREISAESFHARLPDIRPAVGDRALLRALHFFDENERVVRQTALLRAGDIEGFLAEVRGSADSSWRLLQNCYPPGTSEHQDVALAIALSETFLAGDGGGGLGSRAARRDGGGGQGSGAARGDGGGGRAVEKHTGGAARVHGGGFAGTIQTYVPEERADAYQAAMAAVFGEDSVTELRIRNVGAVELCRR